MVYAQAPGGESFKVDIETEPNSIPLNGDSSGRVDRELYYILQTNIQYDIDRSGSKRETTIEGIYESLDEARKQARTILLDEDIRKEDFAEYDELTDEADRPYDSDIIVHAVGQRGENFLVSVVKH
jgi:hypothetical protein